jgi:hypothetical protein
LLATLTKIASPSPLVAIHPKKEGQGVSPVENSSTQESRRKTTSPELLSTPTPRNSAPHHNPLRRRVP